MILLVLPDKFDLFHFNRVYTVVKYYFKKDILIATNRKNFKFYKKIFNNYELLMLPSSKITRKFLNDMNIFSVVVMKNSDDTNSSIEWEDNNKVVFYKDIFLGYGGLRSIGNINNKIQKKFFESSYIFNQITSNIEHSFIFFPYGYLVRYNRFNDINEFGFRIKVNQRDIENRKTDHKLVVILGGSAAFSLFSPYENSFSNLLEDRLNKNLINKYSVLNFSSPSFSVIDSIMTYILHIQRLNPDIVISFDGFNDLFYGYGSNKKFLEEYNIYYNFEYTEFINASIENGFNNKIEKIIEAYIKNKKLLSNLVNKDGGIFLSVLQPILYSKKELSSIENKLFKMFKNRLYENIYEKIKNDYDILSKKIGNSFEYCLNLHEIFKKFDDKITLFGDLVHFIDDGEVAVADELFNYIKKIEETK